MINLSRYLNFWKHAALGQIKKHKNRDDNRGILIFYYLNPKLGWNEEEKYGGNIYSETICDSKL